MDELVRQIFDALHGIWQRRWIGLIVAWVAALAGVALLLRVPDRFEASSRIFVDTETVLRPLLSGLAVQPDVNEQIGMLARTLITRPNIEMLIRNADLSVVIKDERDRERLIDELTREIRLKGGGRENLYDLTYRDIDKKRAQRVVQTLTNMFVESGLGGKRRDNEAATRFIVEQIKTYERKLEEAEGRLKDFKLRHLGDSNAAGQDYFGRMSQISEQLAKARLELREAEQRRDALKRELAGEEPVLLAEPSAIVTPGVPELDMRLDGMHKQLDELLRRYTDQHPDVIALRMQVSQLEEQRRKDLEARRRVTQGQSRSAATNPVFQQIKISLAEAEASVASLRARVGELQSRNDQLRASAGKAPQVEAEMAQLNRDYEVQRKQYEALVSRRESASISGDVDATGQLAEFRIIEPPRVSPKPVFPNRAAIAPLVLIASLGLGVFASLLMSQLFPTVRSARALRDLGQRPVLGTVSLLRDPAMLRRRRRANLAFGGAVSSLVMVMGAWIAWVSLAAGG
jgi:polysaccharide chain length determinant protein (PEP-CTERM system associated)